LGAEKKSLPVLPKDVFRTLAYSDKARAKVMARFRARSGDINRWHGCDRDTMCHALTYTEDELEGKAPTFWLRELRRRLEWELEN
jgi:hypothetical protein